MTLRGFSLIELLVSISIISILIASAMFILRPLDYIKRSRDSRRLSDLKVVQTALEQYYGSNGGYPSSISFGSQWSPYLRLVPADPVNVGSQIYVYVKDYVCPAGGGVVVPSSGSYVLCSNLEMSPPGSCAIGPINFNYCLSNPF